jgi:membrane-associated phospholipid phosphatase
VWLDQAPYARYLQDLLMKDYVRFRVDPSYYTVKLYQGVAALPSLHVGLLALFAIATWRWRMLAIVLWLLTAVTFVGSLALGWHYAVDGYAGLALAALVWLVARYAIALEVDDDDVLALRRGASGAAGEAHRGGSAA